MFGMGMPEILLILAIALIVLGPKKLPEVAKSLGRGIAEFRKATRDFKENLEVDNEIKEARDTVKDIKKDLEDTVRKSVTAAEPVTVSVPKREPQQAVTEHPAEGSKPPLENKPKEEPGP